jgi:ABC-2 type transport system ATP-binding protein
MSIAVKNLTKQYGTQLAINNISFNADKGQVLGFLGPNGAGKTTTMKILTCFMPPTEGTAKICGFDAENDSMEVRSRVGYLPEHNPLYGDMYIKEYLSFVAGIHGLANKKSRIADMIEMTGLAYEQKKQIKTLSKGYRQRVGLAQALIHDPEVLILDEPTSGLDPNQLVEIRKLIKSMGTNKTVILSTHIMQEVQAICDRVIIIDRGKLVANDSIEDLTRKMKGQNLVVITFKEKIDARALSQLPFVKKMENTGGFTYRLTTDAKDAVQEMLFKFAAEKGYVILELYTEKQTVEDVFQQLTGKSKES